MLEQSHMLNQLQSVLISYKQNGDVVDINGQDQSTDKNKISTDDPGDHRMDINQTSVHFQNLTNAIERIKLQVSFLQDSFVKMNVNITQLRNTVETLCF